MPRSSKPNPVLERQRAARFSQTKNARIVTQTNQRLVTLAPGSMVMAIDPGGSTGLAVKYPDATWLTTTLTEPGELWKFLAERPDEVVFEIFSTQNRVDKYMIYTIELVGGIKGVIYTLGIHGFAHSPGKRYPFIQQAEDMLRGQGHTKHEVDALAHLLAHEAR